MTYFPDLSPYCYRRSSASNLFVNVGWLASSGFPTAPARPDVVAALLTCCTVPVALCMGFHTCELCPPSTSMMTMELDGRAIELGNGEIRVVAADGVVYAAPTLVAHYVATHQYAPPEPFVRAALARAEAIRSDVRVLRSLAPARQRAFCVAIVERIGERRFPEWTAAAASALRAAVSAVAASGDAASTPGSALASDGSADASDGSGGASDGSAGASDRSAGASDSDLFDELDRCLADAPDDLDKDLFEAAAIVREFIDPEFGENIERVVELLDLARAARVSLPAP